MSVPGIIGLCQMGLCRKPAQNQRGGKKYPMCKAADNKTQIFDSKGNNITDEVPVCTDYDMQRSRDFMSMPYDQFHAKHGDFQMYGDGKRKKRRKIKRKK